jgi:2-oxo-3-hexenedioate decarboxylase
MRLTVRGDLELTRGILAEEQELLDRSMSTGAPISDPTQRGDDPASVAEALDRQLELADRLVGRGATIGGWKVGLTSRGGRDRLGANVRPFGFILKERLFSSGARIALDQLESCGIEPELCFTIGDRIQGVQTAANIRRSVATVAPAFEINEWRSTRGTTLLGLVADNLAQWGIVVGTSIPITEDFDGIAVDVHQDGSLVADHVVPNIDSHFDSIAKLSSQLADRGRWLNEGDVIITGSFFDARVDAAGSWRADFERVGRVEVSFV